MVSPAACADLVGVKVLIGNCRLTIVVVYIPPALNSESYIIFFDYLESTREFSAETCIMGDFNKPELAEC